TELHALNADAFMLAEAEELNLFDKAFDCCYAWELHHLMCDVAKGRKRANALRDHLYATQSKYPRWAMKMVFTSNHDENSWQGTEQSRFGDALELMTLFTFVVPGGMPLIYTGQEVGYDHSFKFFDRDPIPCSSYASNEVTERYRKLIELKHSLTSLRAGEGGGMWTTIANNAEDCLIALVRETGEDRVVAIMNLSPYLIKAEFNTGIYAGVYEDAITGEEFVLDTWFIQHFGAWEYKLLVKKK
ncbi:MAG: alpha amylase C-terminal domain-containing protein, partial [Rikenellaceae bacterium]